ncbi:hypothetical protein ONZ43_g5381 [Nemania bipapillata]|uniref:Uncharacterized protein n=1 Tax=Nemania bipapillata TaxID=110536 RepID=A0ACC2IBH4_9PEZI|nr:hypothetical protein ONZ43_g5381 [Nemania bipapillata]
MQITDPQSLLDQLNLDDLTKYLRYNPLKDSPATLKKFHLQTEPEVVSTHPTAIMYYEPYGLDAEKGPSPETVDGHIAQEMPTAFPTDASSPLHSSSLTKLDGTTGGIIKGRVMRLGDFIDTDAIIPTSFLHLCETDEEWGSHCMEYFMPEFRDLAGKQGHSIVVAGKGFGVGSSREMAVNALKGCGIKCVIAESFAFIYARNQPNLGLLGIQVPCEGDKKRLYDVAQMGSEIEVDMDASVIRCGGGEFHFELSAMEKQLIQIGGIEHAFERFGKDLFNQLCNPQGPKHQAMKRRRKVETVPDIEGLTV